MTIIGVEHASTALLATLAESAIRALVLAALVGGALTLLRVRRTAWRLSAWTIVLGAALAMPVLGRVLPAWRVPLMSAPALAWLQPATPTTQPAGALVGRIDSSSTTTARGSAADPSARTSTPAAPDVTSLRASAPVVERPSAMLVLLGLYLLGMATFSLRALIGWMATGRLARAACPINDADALARLASVSQSAGCRRAPDLAQSDRLHVPVTLSVARPTVVLPDTWRAWDAAMLDAVLAHEVAHVVRRDALTQRAALLYRAIFWFNPLAWWLPRHLMDLAEQASDEAVLSAGTSQTDYARMLLEFFRALPQPGYRADWHVAMARGAAASAEARVDRILDWKGGQTMRLTRSVVLIAALAAIPVVALTASVQPAQKARPEQATIVMAPPVAASSLPGPAPTQTAALSAASPTVMAPPTAVAPAPGITTEPVTPAADPTPQVQAPPPVAGATTQVDFGAGAYRPGQGVSWPAVVRESKPIYPREALTAGIQGAVELEIVVLPDGTVGPARITKSLDTQYGLDNEAVRAARQWLFTPSQLNGQPVASIVGLVLEFRMHDQTNAPVPGGSAQPRPLADNFAAGAYFTMGTGLVAPQPVGDTGKAQQAGLIAPQIIQQVVPKYTPDGMRAKLQGQVDVEAIVMPDGTIGKARVVRSLDAASGLDESALTAARQSTFKPGTLDGTPVPVLVTMTFYFWLH